MWRYARDERPARGRGHHRRQGRPRAPRAPAGRSRPVPAHRRPQRRRASSCAARSCTSPAPSLVHELVVMPTKCMRQDEADYAVSFSIPTNAPGVKIINRSFAPAELNEFDYPASAHHSHARRLRHLRRRVRALGARVPRRRGPARGRVRALARAVGAHASGMVEAVERAEHHRRPGAARLASTRARAARTTCRARSPSWSATRR